jgi:hypothetical protein
MAEINVQQIWNFRSCWSRDDRRCSDYWPLARRRHTRRWGTLRDGLFVIERLMWMLGLLLLLFLISFGLVEKREFYGALELHILVRETATIGRSWEL